MPDKLKLIIADDERIIRNGLVNSINWESIGYTVTGVFSSGNEAIEYLASNYADVILTDIVMGHGTGIDLAQWTNVHRPYMKVVLITGYADFEMARRAIACRVVHYLLTKPTQVAEIKNVFSTIFESLITQKMSYLQQIDSIRELIQDSAASGCFKDSEITKMISLYENKMGSSISGVYLLLHEPNLLEVEIPEFTSEQSCYPTKGFDIKINQFQYILWCCEASMLDDTARNVEYWAVNTFSSKVYQIVKHNSLSAIINEIILNTNIQLKSRIENRIEDFFAQVADYFITGQYEAIPALFRSAIKQSIPFNILLLGAHKLDLLYRECCVQNSFEYDDRLKNSLLYLPNHGDAFQSLLDWASTFSEICTRNYALSNDRLLANIDQYIENNLSSGITLQDVAKYVHFSTGYLSRLLKGKTGISFTEYVVRAKIHRAMMLLTSSSMTVQNIAAQIGYNDFRYFTHIFKKYANCTPSEYRHNTNRGGKYHEI